MKRQCNIRYYSKVVPFLLSRPLTGRLLRGDSFGRRTGQDQGGFFEGFEGLKGFKDCGFRVGRGINNKCINKHNKNTSIKKQNALTTKQSYEPAISLSLLFCSPPRSTFLPIHYTTLREEAAQGDDKIRSIEMDVESFALSPSGFSSCLSSLIQ